MADGRLFDMSLRQAPALLVAMAIVAGIVSAPSPACAVSSLAAETAADRAAVTRALERYESIRAQASAIDAQVADAVTALDMAMAEEVRCLARLRSRVAAMYRTGDTGLIVLLLGSSSIQDLAGRLDLLERVARQDARDLDALKAARAQARESADSLLRLQEDQARALEAAAAEVERARRELASSEAALREYEAKLAAAAARAAAAQAARAAPPAPSPPDQQQSGTGAWQTAVASHYSRNFSGRGASGERIGPYSMMVAHKTLPFGTLVEFEYKGKRAVASVEDRGPFTPGRDFDLGPGVVRVLDFSGVHEVRYRIVTR
ncbi:MAG: RlpA-like double-psi beta-barrel domain-containing protein [Coriobacteriia bacterium]